MQSISGHCSSYFTFYNSTLCFQAMWQGIHGHPVSYQGWTNQNFNERSLERLIVYGEDKKMYHQIRDFFWNKHSCLLWTFTFPYNKYTHTIQQLSVTKIQPFYQTERNKACLVILLSNLGYPQWVSVNCQKPFVSDLVCVFEDVEKEKIVTNYSSPQIMICPHQISKNGTCFSLVAFKGTHFLQHPSGSSISIFKLLIKAVGDSLRHYLHVDPSNSSRIIAVTYKHTSKILVRTAIKPNDARGFYISQKHLSTAKVESEIVFRCNNGNFISMGLVCDSVNHCNDKNELISDESYCDCKSQWCKRTHLINKHKCSPLLFLSIHNTCLTYIINTNKIEISSEKMLNCGVGRNISKSLKNDLVPDCEHHEDETELLSLLINKTHISCTEVENIPCLFGHSKCYDVSMVCIYRLDKSGHILPCRTGTHLQDCSEFECSKEFKCALYYCIPWGYVCDGIWDCPDRSDEIIYSCVNYKNCREMFSCHETHTCIHIADVCNGFFDCIHGDDEAMCSLYNVKCPQYCQCLLYALYCAHVSIQLFEFRTLPHISYHIVNCTMHTLSLLFPSSKKYLVLDFSYNMITDVCGEPLSLCKSLYSVNFKTNNIILLKKDCFLNMHQLYIIHLESNQIKKMERTAFRNLRNTHLIDLSVNQLSVLGQDIFFNLTRLSTLLLHKNYFKILNPDMQIEVDLKVVVTSTFEICCLVVEETVCKSPRSWIKSCSAVISQLYLKVIFVVVTVLILVLNLFSLSVNFKMHSQVRRKHRTFTVIIAYDSGCNVLCGVYFLLLTTANFYFKRNFGFHLNFSHSFDFFCNIMLSSVTTYSILSPMILLFSCVARWKVVSNPLSSKFKVESFVWKLFSWSTACTVILLETVFVMLEVLFIFDANPLCFPLMTGKLFSLAEIVCVIVCFWQVVSLVLLSAIYISLVIHLIKNPNPGSGQSNFLTKTKAIILFEIVCTALCWVPSNLVFLSSPFFLKNPNDLILWTIVLVLPLNAILHPFMYNFSTLRDILFKPKA